MRIRQTQARSWCTEAVAILLSCIFAVAPVTAQNYSSPEIVGSIAGLNQGANINSHRADLRSELHHNDIVSTDHSGRARVNLRGRCVLTLGSGTQIKLLQSNPISQESSVQLVTGRLRSQLGRFVVQSASYNVHTPHGNIAAHSDADFYLDTNATRTLLVVYSGIALVAPASRKSMILDVAQGQSVELRPNGVTPLQLTSDELEDSSKQETALLGEMGNGFARAQTTPGSHKTRNIVIGLGIAAGAAIGLAMSRSGGNSSNSSSTPPTSNPTPSIPAQ